MSVKEYTNKEVKDFAAHLKTMGAYVQAPNPNIVGLNRFQVIGSQDAKSLYPTIMALLNIGYDTLRGRIYDSRIVGNILRMIESIINRKDRSEDIILEALIKFKSALNLMAKDYTDRVKVKKSKKEFVNFTLNFYGELFRKLISYKGNYNDILIPKTDEQYYLLKSCLYPLLEALTWINPYNKGYSDLVVDHVFYNDKFDDKYKEKSFIVFHNINSSKTQVKIYNCNEFKIHIADKYILNPYGTYFDKHDNNKSFEVDLIFGGMNDRAYVKNQMLIIGAIVENWSKLDNRLQSAFILKNEYLNEEIAIEVINLVGDSNEKTKAWQLKNLKSIKFDTFIDIKKVLKKLDLIAAQLNSKSNGIKVTLNSGYGIYGMATWIYGNNLIANSITSGGKIYGIKLFQQVASNKLKYERNKINLK